MATLVVPGEAFSIQTYIGVALCGHPGFFCCGNSSRKQLLLDSFCYCLPLRFILPVAPGRIEISPRTKTTAEISMLTYPKSFAQVGLFRCNVLISE